MDFHVKSFERYFELSVKAVGVYIFLTISALTLFSAKYEEGNKLLKLVLLIPIATSFLFAFVFSIGMLKWVKKRRGYKILSRRFKQAPDTEMLTLVLCVAAIFCLTVAVGEIFLLRYL